METLQEKLCLLFYRLRGVGGDKSKLSVVQYSQF